jgi:hypothetical protein
LHTFSTDDEIKLSTNLKMSIPNARDANQSHLLPSVLAQKKKPVALDAPIDDRIDPPNHFPDRREQSSLLPTYMAQESYERNRLVP